MGTMGSLCAPTTATRRGWFCSCGTEVDSMLAIGNDKNPMITTCGSACMCLLDGNACFRMPCLDSLQGSRGSHESPTDKTQALPPPV